MEAAPVCHHRGRSTHIRRNRKGAPLSLDSTEQHGNPHGDTVTELLQIAARSYLADPWNDSKERALASVIRAACGRGWSHEDIASATDVTLAEQSRVLGRWSRDVA